jgi:4-amino-4-deoxy-L-arabinose transferase-like glycosyltransferase
MPAILDRVPRPLLALWGVLLVVTVAWALFLPPWQSPDESQHVAYAQSVAERFALPGDRTRKTFSTEQDLADNRSRTGREGRIPGAEWRPDAFARWQRSNAKLPASARRDGGGRNAAAANPPLYYLFEALPYRAFYGTSIFGRLLAMRIWSGLLLLVTATATWLLAGELLGRVRTLQLTAAATAGLAPMTGFMSASVNPDAMLYALWSVALWLGVRVLKRGLTMVDGAGLFAVLGLAVTTKATSYALVPAALLVLAIGTWRLRRPALRAALVTGAVALAAFAVPAGAWVVAARSLHRATVNQVTTATDTDSGVPLHPRNSFNVKGFVSYVRQFYLPNPRSRGALFPSTLPLYSVWFKGAWGVFGWRQFRLAPAVFFVLAALSLAALAAAGVAIARGRVALDLATVAFIVVAALGLLLALHVTEYRIIFVAKERGDFNQGRYLLPLVSLGGVAVAAGLSLLGPRRRAHAAAALLALLVTLQLLALGTVAEWFYA